MGLVARSFGAVHAAFVVLMASTTLGGCYLGPSPVQYAALAVVDGRATAFVASCGRSSVEVRLYLNDGSGGPLRLWSVSVAVPDQAESVEVELLGSARPGWEITSADENLGGGSDTPRVVQLTTEVLLKSCGE
jgi:hypothetical protein